MFLAAVGAACASMAILAAVIFTPSTVDAAPATGFVLETYATGMGQVTDLEWATNGNLYVANKTGGVFVVSGPANVSPFVDISDDVNSASDRGLLGIAVHPNLTSGSPFVYLLYTYDPPEAAQNSGFGGRDGNGQRVSRLTRFTADAATNFTTVVPGSAVTILGGAGNWVTAGDPTFQDSQNSANWACGNRILVQDCIPADGKSHTIGTVTFGTDAMLYVGNGDSSQFSVANERSFRA